MDTSLPDNGCPDATDAGVDAGARDAGPADGGGGEGGTERGARCAAATTCAACRDLSSCGFCDGRCVPGDDAGPTGGTRCAGTYSYGSCPETGNPCAAMTTCDACAGAASMGCAWCADAFSGETPHCVHYADYGDDCFNVRTEAAQCQSCGDHMDCASCAGASGCGWCGAPTATSSASAKCILGSTDAPDEGCASTYTGTGPMCMGNPCASVTSCGGCIDKSGCGWCDGQDTCLPGTFFGPADGYSCAADWDWFHFACDNTPVVTGCGVATECASCVMRTATDGSSCHWCDRGGSGGSCVDPGMCASGTTDIATGSACPGACQPELGECSMDSDCCTGMLCIAGLCRSCAPGEQNVGASCADTTACCAPLDCQPVGFRRRSHDVLPQGHRPLHGRLPVLRRHDLHQRALRMPGHGPTLREPRRLLRRRILRHDDPHLLDRVIVATGRDGERDVHRQAAVGRVRSGWGRRWRRNRRCSRGPCTT